MKTLLTHAGYMDQADIDNLHTLGLEVTYQKDEHAPVENPAQYEALICMGLYKHTPLQAFTNLKYIQLCSAGFEFLPLDYLDEKGIVWHRAEFVHGPSVADHTLCGVLDLYRGRRFFDAVQRDHHWPPYSEMPKMFELNGKNVCIIGAGQIGTEIAKRFGAFGCRVKGIARQAGDRPFFDAVKAPPDLEKLLPESDIVVLSLPRSSETNQFFDANCISLMKNNSILVNIGRGTILDESALIEALQSDRLMGAVLDVFVNEPLESDSPFWDMKNVILTPHCAGSGDKKRDSFMACLEKNLKAFFA